MKTIWKFPVPIQDTIRVSMPVGAKILCAQMQQGNPYIWALVDSQKPIEEVSFLWRGTGHPTEDEVGFLHHYVGTVQMADGNLVFHLFEERAIPF